MTHTELINHMTDAISNALVASKVFDVGKTQGSAARNLSAVLTHASVNDATYFKLWDNQRKSMFDGTGSVERGVWGFVVGSVKNLTVMFIWDGTFTF